MQGFGVSVRRPGVVLAVATLLQIVFLVPLGSAGRAAAVPELKPGESAFWEGEYVEGTFKKDYQLRTTNRGHRLRVALDVVMGYKQDGSVHEGADAGRGFRISVLDGSTELRGGATNDGPAGYSAEVYLCFNGDPCEDVEMPCPAGDAACGSGLIKTGARRCDAEKCYLVYGKSMLGDSAGNWTLRVTGSEIDGWKFRVRAMLEEAPTSEELSRLDEPVLPNLRPRPPFELTLGCTPVNGSGGTGRTGTCDPALQGAVPGCSVYEVANSPSVRWCLRFSSGEENVGDGPLVVEGANPEPAPDGSIFDAVQVVMTRNENAAFTHDAGELVYHPTHGHWHYAGFMHYELMEVDTSGASPRSRGTLTRRDPGPKAGWCPVDEFLAEWGEFSAQPRSTEGDGGNPSCLKEPPRFTQTTGWGDIYEWQVDESFVPFPVDGLGAPRQGLYVLRDTVDPEDKLLETNNDDNTSYAYFAVASDGSVKLLERGYGMGPWDVHKKVV